MGASNLRDDEVETERKRKREDREAKTVDGKRERKVIYNPTFFHLLNICIESKFCS